MKDLKKRRRVIHSRTPEEVEAIEVTRKSIRREINNNQTK
jgi:hypothetical protein